MEEKNKQYKFSKPFFFGLLLLTGAILLILPSVSVGSLMNGTQSGKTIFFLYLMIGTGGILGLRLILSPAGRAIRISLVYESQPVLPQIPADQII
ncbi:MAG: hypothetical protein ABFD10_05625 [Prolixibacteraceae bacterium]